MEDAATAEIARVQLWSWAFHGPTLNTGLKVTPAYITSIIDEESKLVSGTGGISAASLTTARDYLVSQVHSKVLSEFLTSDLMPHLDAALAGGKL